MPYEITYGVAIAEPICREGLVLVCGYWNGSKAIRLGSQPQQAELAWEENKFLRGLMSQPLYRDGYVYLLDKQYGLTCFELTTSKKLWDDDNQMTPRGRNPHASLVWLGDVDRAITLNSEGDLVLARLNVTGYHEQPRTNIIGFTWAHPAFAGSRVYACSDNGAGGMFTHTATTTLNLANRLDLVLTGDNVNESYGLKTLSLKTLSIEVAGNVGLTNNGPVNEGISATVTFSAPLDPSTVDTAAGFHFA